jgi:hypothetical protein
MHHVLGSPFLSQMTMFSRSVSKLAGNVKTGPPTVAIHLLSCHKYLSYFCMNLFRWLTMLHFGFFLFLTVFDHFLLKQVIGQTKESHTISMVEFAEQFLHVKLLLFHMGLVALDILNLKKERLEDNDEVVKKCFKLRGFYFESVKLILLLVLAYSWHSHVPSAVLEYDFLVYLLTCLIVGRRVNFIISRKFHPVHNDYFHFTPYSLLLLLLLQRSLSRTVDSHTCIFDPRMQSIQ